MYSLVNPQIHSRKKTPAIASSKRYGSQTADEHPQIPTLSSGCLGIKRNKDRRHRHKRPEMLSNVWGCQAEVVYYEDVFAQRVHRGTAETWHATVPLLIWRVKGLRKSAADGIYFFRNCEPRWRKVLRWVQLVWHMGQELSSVPQVLQDSTVKAGNITL